MLRPRLRIPRVGSLLRRTATPLQGQFRPIHAVPNLGQFPRPEDGVPGLLSGDGFDIAWTQYMDFVIEKLNALTAGTEFENKQPLQILKETARQPRDAPTFNYASMAHNNAFFFEQLARLGEDPANPEAGLQPVPVPEKLRLDLERDFSSMETLRREMIITADVMFGPGFVWLVKLGRQSQFRILTTYLAGTPYTAAHWRRQGVDMNNHGGGLTDGVAREFLDRTQVGVGAGHVGRFDNNASAPGGTEVIPLLCINTWEHVWLRDWGIGAGGIGGKRAFASAWWECIDWDKVYNLAYPSPTFK